MFLNRGTATVLLALFFALLLSACSTSSRPANIDNLCHIFNEKPQWYKAAKKSSERWQGPLELPMAIMYQESSFKRKARPPMAYFLGVIPVGRPSDAYGYSQALKSTWADYEREAGSAFSSRKNFANAYDFIHWYLDKTHKVNKVSKWDGYAQYLNYHEGQGGYARGTHQNKTWLLDTARRVDQRAKKYANQLAGCRAELDKRRSWFR